MAIRRALSLGKRGFLNYVQNGPYSVSFEVTYACNAHCQHCHLGGPVKEEERATPKRLAKVCHDIHPVEVIMSGGEPLMRNDLEDIVRAIRRKNGAPYIVCTTNAGLLTKRRYQSLREAGVDHFSISLDYPDERHDEFRRIPGLFQKIRDLVGGLDSGVKKPITLSCCVQRSNFREMLKFARLSADWKVRVNFSTYTWMRTKNKELLLTTEDLSELREIVNQLMELKKRNKNFYPSSYTFQRMIRYFEDGYIPGCRAGQRFFVVNPNGAVSPCGLIMKYYKDVAQMRAEFVPTNTCGYCNTTVRSECEKPVQLLVRDNLESM